LFVNSVLAPQDSVNSFATQTANKRKEILLEIIKAEDFDDYYKRARDLLSQSKEELVETEAHIKYIKESIDKHLNIAKSLDHIPKELEKSQKASKVLKDLYNARAKSANDLQSSRKEYNDIGAKIEKLKDDETKCGVDIADVEQKLGSVSKVKLDEMKKSLSEFDKKSKELKGLKKIKESFDIWREKKAALQSQMPTGRDFSAEESENEEQIAVLNAKTVMECPDLNKPCPVFEKEKQERINFYEKRLKEIADEKTSFMNMMSEYQLKVKAIGEEPKIDLLAFRRLSDEIDSLIQLKIQFEKESQASEFLLVGLESEKGTLSKLYKQYGEEIKELEEKKRLLGNDVVIYDELREELKTIDGDIERNKESLTKLSINNDRLETAEREAKEDKISLKGAMKCEKDIEEKCEGLKMLKDAFGSKGIQDLLIDWSLPQLEDKINKALGQMSDFRITLSTQKANVGGTATKDGLWISVINEEGEEMDFCSYSGGERVKIKAAISSGLAELSRIGFRIYDELFVALDEDSTESFVDVVTSMKENIKQLLVVSHLPAVKDVFVDKIKISKKNGVSSAKI